MFATNPMPGSPSIKIGLFKTGFSYNNTLQTNKKPPSFINYLIHLQSKKTRRNQLKTINWILKKIESNADLSNTEQVTKYILNRPISEKYKSQFAQIYSKYCRYMNIPYTKPKFKLPPSRPIRIPTEEKINMIIAESGKTLATKLILSKETGLRPVEVHMLYVKDIDLDQRLVYPTTAKNGAPRTVKISERLASLLRAHITRYNLKENNLLFKGREEHYTDSFSRVRNRLAEKIQDPTIKRIRLYDLRHFFATMLYHKTKDILLVKQQLGHKSINNTLIYIDLEATLYNTRDEWTCRTAQNVEEATKLIEAGFEKADEMDGIHIYRKRK